MKTFVYKLRPSPAQAALFDETLQTCRRLYNHALAERKTAYTERGETLAFARQSASLPQLKHTWHELKRVHSQVLQDVLHRLQHAFDGFFRRLKAAQTPGRVTGLGLQHVEIAMLVTPDGHSRLELSRFLTPPVVADHRSAPVNALGYLRVMFAVDDIDDTLARLQAHGAQLVGEVVQYEDSYRLCYIRGPEGLLIGLAEQLGQRVPG